MIFYFINYSQVGEKEHFVQQLKEDIEKEENNCNLEANLQLCQVSIMFSYSIDDINKSIYKCWSPINSHIN